MSLLDEFFANEFLTLIEKRTRPTRGRKKRASGKSAGALGPSARLAALGFDLAPAFGKFLDFAASHARSDVGALCMFSINDVVPGLKDDTGTIRASRRALELDPKNAYAMYNLATTLLVNGKTEGRKLLERACKLAPVLRDDAERDPDIVSALAALER